MAWVKLHDDILGDPKLMRAARVGGSELVLLPWLLAFASKSADHGRLSVGATAAEPEDIAYQTPGVTAAQVEACQRTLVAIGVLVEDDDGCLRFTKWDDRQVKPSDSKAAWRERKQRSRAKKKQRHTPSAGQGVTVAESEADSDAKTGDVTPRHATDKRRGEEKREEKHSADAVPVTDRKASWVTDGVSLWESIVGAVPHVQFGAALKPMVLLHGWPAVRPDLEKWARERVAAGKPCNPSWYAKEATARLTPKPPLVDEHGSLTEYGERMTRPEKVSA